MSYATISRVHIKKRNLLQGEVGDILETLRNDPEPIPYVYDRKEKEITALIQNKGIKQKFPSSYFSERITKS